MNLILVIAFCVGFIPYNYAENNLPKYFDSRSQWPHCKNIKVIRNQGTEISCHTFTAVDVMSDRYCIHSTSRDQFHFSALDVESCGLINISCNSNDAALNSWKTWVYNGIVSGGEYNSGEGCKPYPYDPKEEKLHNKTCEKQCKKRPNYNVTYEDDKRKGKNYKLLANEIDEIMEEIYNNGPVQAHLELYEDMLDVKTEVYVHGNASFLRWHSVKIIGWGEEELTKELVEKLVEKGLNVTRNVEYWLCANSWGTEKGDKGFFKILRGVNHCMIESLIYSGFPKWKQRHIQSYHQDVCKTPMLV